MSDAPAKKSAVKVHVLRCRSTTCGSLLPFEETDEGLLLGNMYEVATRDGDTAFFPCPSCRGRNLVEEAIVDGKKRTRVTAFVAA